MGELAAACEKRGLGFFLYYSYGADWRHPYFLSNDVGVPCSRPEYPVDDPAYRYAREEDFQHYLRFVDNQLRELLCNYGSVAGVWFDLVSPCYYRPDLSRSPRSTSRYASCSLRHSFRSSRVSRAMRISCLKK
ncbi:alpha-L-fucosidase [Jiangella alba]|uniref:alpha-L-fucosidase n=1 Tax=Jiangella alba TaxID=561176 RepID=UPI000945C443